MTIFEKARELGEMITETEQGKRLNDARFVFDGSEEAQRLLFEYTDFRQKIQYQMENGEMSKEKFEEAKEYMAKKADELKAHPIVGEMLQAENEFNFVVNQVMEILKATITGEESSGGCNGSCSGCSGCH